MYIFLFRKIALSLQSIVEIRPIRANVSLIFWLLLSIRAFVEVICSTETFRPFFILKFENLCKL